jgi:lysyl-tRNA synthetase class 2
VSGYIESLVKRAGIVKAVRAFFDSRGFIEVETAVRIDAPAPEPHIDCPPVGTGGFLRASPELQMKKLLAAGMERIYQIGPCFRDGEKGSRHNPEFTMLEWYRRGADYGDIRRDTEELVRGLFAAEGREDVVFKSIGVREMYRDVAGWDPWEQWDADRFDFDMAVKIEPAIREMGGGVFLVDYPVQAASLARISPVGTSGSRHAERWEFYWDGTELANCFSELCDCEEQRARFSSAKEERKGLGESDYPIDEEFFGCLGNIESAAGVALGIDRLVMAVTGNKEISAVRAGI